MSANSLLRFQIKFAHDWLEGTMQGVTPEIAHWQPEGKAHPIGSQYVHVVTSEDALVNAVIQGGAPLMAGDFAGKTGFAEAPPQGNRDDWARSVQVDLDAARSYAQAVYEATDVCLAAMSDDELSRELDLTGLGFGVQSVSFVLNLLILNAYSHAGEISCLKGLQGLKGYPA